MDQIECARERQPKHARAIGRNEAYGSVWEHVSTVLAVAVLMMCRGAWGNATSLYLRRRKILRGNGEEVVSSVAPFERLGKSQPVSENL